MSVGGIWLKGFWQGSTKIKDKSCTKARIKTIAPAIYRGERDNKAASPFSNFNQSPVIFAETYRRSRDITMGFGSPVEPEV